MDKQVIIQDFLQNGSRAFFNFVAEGALPEGKGLMTFLYDEEAVDYCIYHPNEWALYLSVIVRDEDGNDPYLSFSPGLMRHKALDENSLDGEWESKHYLDYLNGE